MVNRKCLSLFLSVLLVSAFGSLASPELAIAAEEQSVEKSIHNTFGLDYGNTKVKLLQMDQTILSLIGEGQYEHAISKADELIQKSPDDLNYTPSAYVCKIFSYMQLGQYDEAIACCETLRNRYADNNRPHLGSGPSMRLWIDFVVPSTLACIYLEKGEENKALNELERNIGKALGNPEGMKVTPQMLDSLATSLRRRGLYKLAIAEYNKIIEKYPDDLNVIPGCYHGKVWAYIGLKEYDKAIQTCDALANRFKNSTELSPGSGVPMSIRIGGAHGLKAKVYEAQEKWPLAIREYQSQIDFLKQSGILNTIPAERRNLMEKRINIDLPKLIEACRAKMRQ